MTFIDVVKLAKNMGECVSFLALRESWEVGRFLEKSYDQFLVPCYLKSGYLQDLTIDDYLADDWYLLNKSERKRAQAVADKISTEKAFEIVAEWEKRDLAEFGHITDFTRKAREDLEKENNGNRIQANKQG